MLLSFTTANPNTKARTSLKRYVLIKGLIACAIEIYQEKGEPVPEPVDRDHFKGKILYRTDSERHYLIAKTAQRMHKSISKTLDTLIDKGLEQLRAI